MGPIFQLLSSVPGQPVPSSGAVAHLGESRSAGAGPGLLQGAFPLSPQSSACARHLPWVHPLFPVSLGSRDGDNHGKIRLIHDASCLCGPPPSAPGTRGFSGSWCPAGAGILLEEVCSRCAGGRAEAMRPFPTRWQWDSPAGAGMCSGWDPVPEGLPGAHSGCTSGGTPPYLRMLLPNKELLEQISASQCDLGILGVWLSWSL